jgi:hypothetical protein
MKLLVSPKTIMLTAVGSIAGAQPTNPDIKARPSKALFALADQNDARVSLYIALSEEGLNQPNAAIQFYERSLKLDHVNTEARAAYSRLLRRQTGSSGIADRRSPEIRAEGPRYPLRERLNFNLYLGSPTIERLDSPMLKWATLARDSTCFERNRRMQRSWCGSRLRSRIRSWQRICSFPTAVHHRGGTNHWIGLVTAGGSWVPLWIVTILWAATPVHNTVQ